VNEVELRERAEEALRRRDHGAGASTKTVESVLYEYEVTRTELKLQNEELRQREEELDSALRRFSAVYDVVPIALLTVDRKARIVEANEGSRALLDRGRGSLRDQSLPSLVEEADCIPLNRALRSVLADGGSAEIDVAIPGENGTLDVQMRLSRVELDDEPHLVVAMVDRTPEVRHTERLAGEVDGRRRAERELDETRERLATIVQTAVDAILTIDEDGVIESFNPAAERLFGYSAEEALGRTVLMLVPVQDRDFFARRLAEYQSGQLELAGIDVEIDCLEREGTTFPASLVISEMVIGGRRLLTGIVRDLSEKKELEEQLRHAQKMEAIGTLATGVAHDFNNLLMGISGCVELASRHVPFGGQAHTHLDDIREATQSGAEIARQLLAFARRQKTRKKRFVVDDVVRQLARLLKTLVGEGVELQTDLGAPAGGLLADPAQFEQVLMNLVINARDAMPDGGVIHIETRTVFEPEPPGDLEPGEYVQLVVSDTGTGIPRALADRIFEPFFTTKKPGRGTGLGLSTVHGIVQSMRGTIDFDSAVDEGTRFEIRLPLVPASLDDEPSSGEFAPEPSSIRPRTLVVEDDRLVRRTVVGYLHRLGHEVAQAATLQEALVAADALDGLDLLITDSALTDGDGVQVAREVSREHPGIGVVFMSAHGFDSLVEEEKVPPNARFLQKPFTREDLAPEIHKALEARTAELAVRKRPQPVVLIIDDHRASRLALRASLEELGYSVLEAGSAGEATRVAAEWEYAVDVVLMDVRLPDGTGPQLSRQLAREYPYAATVYMSGLPRELAAMRYELPDGALFLEKPFELSLVADILSELAPVDPD
jgi:PAS domain S-box-containing protein